MNSYEYLLKFANEQLGYSAQPPTSAAPRSGGPGAPALPPAPSVAPTTMAPPPSPKTGGLIDDVQTARRQQRWVHWAENAGFPQEPFVQRYRTARNTALKSLGLHGLGLGLGGLALYGAGRHFMKQEQPPAHPPAAEDFAASYRE